MKRSKVWMLASILALGGMSVSTVGAPLLTVQAAEEVVAAKEYTTQGGIANMGSGTANITIKGNAGQTLIGKKFHVYKLFLAQNAQGMESINYTFNPAYEQALKNVASKALSVPVDEVTEYMVIDYIQSLNSYKVEGAQTEQELEGRYSKFRYFVEDLRNEIEKQGVQSDVVNIKDIKSDNSVQLTGLEFGYYLVDEITDVEGTHSAGSLCMVSTANPSAEMQVKSDYPSVIKKIQEDDQNPNLTDPDGWNDIGDYEIGQTVPYKYESNIPNMNGYKNYYYAWHDKMDKALTFKPESVKITISDEKGKSYTLKEGEFTVKTNPGGGDSFQVVVQDMKSIVDKQFPNFNEKQENTYGQKVTLTYEATLNDLAANDTGRPGFENDVRLEFSNDADSNNGGSTGFTPWDTVVCFTYRIDIVKTNDHDKVLQGAHFRLYSDKDCKNEVYVKQGDTGYHVINRDSAGGTDHTGGSQPQDAVEMVSGADGQVILIGLDQGTYWLKETKAPDGYRLLKDPIEIKIIPTYTDDRNNYIKGQGATAETLKELQATAHIKSFYDGVTDEKDLQLETDPEQGNANLTVVNKVGSKLPVTGTPALAILLITGTGLMAVAMTVAKARKKE